MCIRDRSWSLLDASGFGGYDGIFGVFYIPFPTVSTTVDSARIYPNPFLLSRSPFVKIDQVPAGAQLKLYTLSGDKVCELAPANEAVSYTHLDVYKRQAKKIFPVVPRSPSMGQRPSLVNGTSLGCVTLCGDLFNRDSPVGTGPPTTGCGTEFPGPPGRKCSVN